MSTYTSSVELLNEDNYTHAYFRFRERQAGVSEVYSPEEERFFYNAYCMETKLVKELLSSEYEFLSDALAFINSEFASWELVEIAEESGCGSCSAKKA